jgi:hypothetical protein
VVGGRSEQSEHGKGQFFYRFFSHFILLFPYFSRNHELRCRPTLPLTTQRIGAGGDQQYTQSDNHRRSKDAPQFGQTLYSPIAPYHQLCVRAFILFPFFFIYKF